VFTSNSLVTDDSAGEYFCSVTFFYRKFHFV